MKVPMEKLKNLSILKFLEKSEGNLSAKEIFESNKGIWNKYKSESSRFQHTVQLLKKLNECGLLQKKNRKYSITTEGVDFIQIEEKEILSQFYEDLLKPFKDLEEIVPYVI